MGITDDLVKVRDGHDDSLRSLHSCKEHDSECRLPKYQDPGSRIQEVVVSEQQHGHIRLGFLHGSSTRDSCLPMLRSSSLASYDPQIA
jgi:hypothetical protein